MSHFEQEYGNPAFDEMWDDIARQARSTETVAVTGDTYRHRRELAGMGGKWDGRAKAWMVPVNRIDDARKLRGVAVSR